MASVATHGVATVLSVIGLLAMLGVAEGEPARVVSAWIFGGSLIVLYLASTLYHALTTPRLKAFMQWLDHVCIYLLIAGSYTPLTLVAIPGNLGWTLLAAVWFLALAGMLLKTLRKGRRDSMLSTLMYIGLGWIVVVAVKPIIAAIGPDGMAWIVAGGVFYTAGTIFFAWRSLAYNHAIWHLFVMAGSFCHVMAVLHYILRIP